MRKWELIVYRWLPAIVIMLVIFIASATPGNKIHNFGAVDLYIKKAGHFTAYAFLAVAYFYAIGFTRYRAWLIAWVLTVLFAASDEFHQSFTYLRDPSIRDVLIDSLGAATGLLLTTRLFLARSRLNLLKWGK